MYPIPPLLVRSPFEVECPRCHYDGQDHGGLIIGHVEKPGRTSDTVFLECGECGHPLGEHDRRAPPDPDPAGGPSISRDRLSASQPVLLQAVERCAKPFHITSIFRERCHCGAEPPHHIVGYRKQNGSIDVRGWCLRCGRWVTTGIGGLSAEVRRLVVIVKDNSADDARECARCHAFGPTELHHWAPVSMFDDADEWPVSELCPDCHRRWHRRTGLALGRDAA